MPPRSVSADRDARALQLHRAKVETNAIAERLGVHRKRVWQMIRNAEDRERLEKVREADAALIAAKEEK